MAPAVALPPLATSRRVAADGRRRLAEKLTFTLVCWRPGSCVCVCVRVCVCMCVFTCETCQYLTNTYVHMYDAPKHNAQDMMS